MKTPFFSIICPIFNSGKFVDKTIHSVLAQTLQDFELILIDDGSQDNTCAVIENIIHENRSVQIRLLKGLHKGPGAARNKGIKAAEGEWISFLDSDDIWEPNKLQMVFDVIDSNKEVNFICHTEEHVHLDGTKNILNYGAWYDDKISLSRQLYLRNLFSTSAVVCKKTLLLEFGLFDEYLMSTQDYELWLRLSPQIKVNFISEKLGYYYDRGGNISSQKQLMRVINTLKILFRYRNLVSRYLYYKQSLKITVYFLLRALKKSIQRGKK